MLSVKQGSIKYHFLSLWYDSTWDWTPVSRTIGEHSTQANLCLSLCLSVSLSLSLSGIHTYTYEYKT